MIFFKSNAGICSQIHYGILGRGTAVGSGRGDEARLLLFTSNAGICGQIHYGLGSGRGDEARFFGFAKGGICGQIHYDV